MKKEETQGELKIIGSCPICKKGKIVKGTNGYMCNYFKSIDDQCQFTIYKSYFGKEITEEIAIKLLKEEKTEIFDDLQKKDGTLFSAAFIIDDGFVKPQFANKIMDYNCPKCGNKVEELMSGYACEKYMNKDEEDNRECNFFIPKTIATYDLTNADISNLVNLSETDFLENKFKNKQGDTFSARLIRDEEGNINFSNILCKCPKCGGNIYSSTKAFSCSNWKNEEIKCDFVIWKQIAGRDITAQEAIILCENKITPVLNGFKSKEKGEFSKMLSLNEDFKIIMI